MWVYDNRRIARNYLHGWFGIDVVTCIPFDVIISALANAGQWTINGMTFRLLRMLRIMKLARIVRASRILSRWQDHIGLSYAYTSLFRFLLITLVLAHWLACLWGFVGLADEQGPDFSWPDDVPPPWEGYFDAGVGGGWRHKAGVLQAGPWDHYGMALCMPRNQTHVRARTPPFIFRLCSSIPYSAPPCDSTPAPTRVVRCRFEQHLRREYLWIRTSDPCPALHVRVVERC